MEQNTSTTPPEITKTPVLTKPSPSYSIPTPSYKKIAYLFSAAAIMTPSYLSAAVAGGGKLKWSDVQNDTSDVTSWIRKVMVVIMAIFIMVAIVLGSLAFKQLAADGNWKDFWSKIAGSIGMFVVPVVIYWLVLQ